MKYLITDINAKQDSNFKNVINFVDTNTRDKYINRKLFNQGTRYDYTQNINGIVVTHDIKPDGNGVITITSPLTHTELSNKNYIILDECGVIKFYFINQVRKLQGTSEYKLTLKEDVFCTYPDVMTKIRYLSLIEGHVPVINYANYEFSGGKTVREDFNIILPIQHEKNVKDKLGNEMTNNVNVLAFMRANSRSEMFSPYYKTEKFNDATGDYSERTGNYYSGHQLLVGVFDDRTKIKDVNASNFTNIMYYIAEKGDSRITSIKITTYDVAANAKDVDTDLVAGTVRPVRVKEAYLSNYDDYNKYKVPVPSDIKSVLELLPGVNKYSISIDTVKDFKFPIEYIVYDEETGKYSLNWKQVASITPSEMREGMLFEADNYYPNEEYSWINETEIAIFTNQYNEYKVNNPNNWAEYTAPLEQIANPLTWLTPETFMASAFGIATGTAKTAIRRNSIKKQPGRLDNTNKTLYTLAADKYAFNFKLAKNKFLGNERKAIIDVVYRNGLQLQNEFLIDTYEDIKRPKFNYIRSINASESLDYESDYPESVVEQFANIFNRGVRVWQDIENFKTYDSKWIDNGEGIDDFVANKNK